MNRSHRLTMAAAAVLLVMPLSVSLAQVQRPPRPTAVPRPTRPPRPVRGTPTPLPTTIPTPTATPPTVVPTVQAQGCRTQPPYAGDTRLNHIYYAYPGADRSLRASGTWRTPLGSNGIDFLNETGSVSLLDSQGGVMIEMTDLHFSATSDSSYAASTAAGFLAVQAISGGYFFSFTFDNPTDLIIPPDLFSGAQHLCVQIGDDGAWERFVCQMKPGGGFLCHE